MSAFRRLAAAYALAALVLAVAVLIAGGSIPEHPSACGATGDVRCFNLPNADAGDRP